jgi:hypothetical protein
VADLRAAHPDKAVEVWAEDEARLGLKPVARRAWAPRGQRPRSCGRARYEWLYVYGFARPATGQTFTVILPRVKVERMAEALQAFAAWADPSGEKVLVLVVDRAGWHTAKRLAVPPNVVLHHLPSCTPELQPAEPLWPLVREGLANKTFPTLAALTVPLERRCRWLADHPDVVKGAVGFHWAVALG